MNFRIHAFDYGTENNINKPSGINECHIKNRCLIMSSSEMRCLVDNFNLLIGHIIPENNKFWSLYLQLKHLIDIIWSSAIHIETHQYLEVVVEDYLTTLVSIFPQGLKPKHHFLVHYARSMKLFGPLGKISCLRNEAKNKVGKNISKVTSSRLNLNKTVAIKHQLMLNYRFISRSSEYSTYKYGKENIIGTNNIEDFPNFANYLPKNLNDIASLTWIEFQEKRIKENAILVKFCKNGPKFYIVYRILKIERNDIFILAYELKDCFLEEHFSAYKIYDINKRDYKVFLTADLESCAITDIIYQSSGFFFYKEKLDVKKICIQNLK